ncbi:hypothetical protein [Alkalihalobacterium chitinilyticum]|uniref:Uracil-DNA glycosylase n=1 Tax=Alkalihalobacterium chitinilyticum TaxID=2980103 RepID=A0ABT5VCD6_9BACI|nr:hypothetical protein [Alkalihalobacterium chitinilyticum]MDE5412831.1 hypothetical protein [Alkalihalobacterium chitinilyticum]
MGKEQYHCCAACKHFRVLKNNGNTQYFCSRLKYETKPNYQFNCWEPKESVLKIMQKRGVEKC